MTAAPLTIGAGASGANLTVSLTPAGDAEPALIEAHVELPEELRLAPNAPLSAVAPIPLDGDYTADRFVVLCGDSSNVVASPLPAGPLFRLRVEPATPRTPGTYTVTLHDLRGATSAGAAVSFEPSTLTVQVTVE